MTGQIIYEHPMNEKCRTLLRLSHLFEQMDFHVPQDGEWHARMSISSLMDIVVILARSDIKSELLKELDRFSASLSKMANTPGVDGSRLQHILQDISRTSKTLATLHGQLGHSIRSDEFLNSILQRSSIAGGSFDFDLPQYHYWLNQSQSERAIQFDGWRSDLNPVQDAVDLVIGLIRNSAEPVKEQAESGFFQRGLASKTTVQLVRVAVANESGLFAEISGGKHRFSIRFKESNDWQHPKQSELNVAFSLTTCII